MDRLTLDGLATMPAQTWGGVRLVPLVRAEPIESLRLHHRGFPDADMSDSYNARYSYAPHGLVAEWTDDGTAVPPWGTALQMAATTVRKSRRPPSRLGRHTRVHFVSHQTALEAYFPLSFQGPSIAWAEWRWHTLDYGVPPLEQPEYEGTMVADLADALQVFEIHPGQCGVLVYVADALAGALVTPHPDDYRALHPTLVQDCYGELIWRYAHLHPEVPDFEVRLDASAVRTVADLRSQVDAARRDWARFHDGMMAAGLLAAEYAVTEVCRMESFTLSRLRPRFEPRSEAHIGEVITDPKGRIAYLHTFRLSETQIKRGQLLAYLSEHAWNLRDTAAAMGLNLASLEARIKHAGFDAMLDPEVLQRYRKAEG